MDDKKDWVWLEHPTTGGKQLFPPAAAGNWRSMGWVDTTAPEEPHSLGDPAQADEPPTTSGPVETPAKNSSSKEKSRG